MARSILLIYMSILLSISIVPQIEASIMDWIWKKSDDTTVMVADGVPLVSIPYEALTEDEKFLQEAAKFSEIRVSSPLETCQHKVVMKIKTSCSDMSEEELAKLSVNLLNCQSAVEGRKMFPCTEDMTIQQCTTNMDPDMWNAYHLMSNRARAVCYSARSTQFRALSEITVNKLMQTAHSQIQALSSLKESQERLEQQTVEALSSLNKGNEALLQQQQHLKDIQMSAHKLVSTNLRDLNNEKALIRTGHAQLAVMTEDIKKKLEKASQDLLAQSVENGENHKELLEDLTNIREQATLIWEKIESSTERIILQHEDAIKRYEEALQKLGQINETVQFIWDITSTMRSEVDEKLAWITTYIGDTGEQLHRIYRVSLHVIYILVAMIVAAFLHAPLLTRITIIGIVPLNLASYLKHGMEASLDFISITLLIVLITGMHFVMGWIQYIFSHENTKSNVIEQPRSVLHNGLSNGDAHKYTSSSYSNSVPKESLIKRLRINAQKLWNGIQYHMSKNMEQVNAVFHSMISWSRRSVTPHEELSCSYRPSAKLHESIVYNHNREFPSVSEDDTYREYPSNVTDDRFDDNESLEDANQLRQRLARRCDTLRNPRGSSTPRGMSPQQTAPRVLCNAWTRSGRRCRLYASRDQEYCSRHSTGSSVIGD